MNFGKQTQRSFGGLALLVVCLLLVPRITQAATLERGGKEVVDAICGACHEKGASGAPRIGDKQAWAARTAHGIDSLTQHAINGIRKMPAHGGNAKVSDYEIQRAITYMVNQSGGNWIEPTNKKRRVPDRSGKAIVEAHCVKCHRTGVDGAPKIGDRAAWIPRGANGFDALVRSAINGHGGMPPRGGAAAFTDAELREAVVYMFNEGAAAKK